MYLQLGAIILEPIESPLSHSESQDVSWAEHALLNSKSRLQPTGLGLKELTMEVRLHVTFGSIKDRLKQLSDARDGYAVLPLVWGDGSIGSNYVLTQMSETRESSFSDGAAQSVQVSLTLREYFITPAEAKQKEQTVAKKNAKAVNQPGGQKKKSAAGTAALARNPSPCNAVIIAARKNVLLYTEQASSADAVRAQMVLAGKDRAEIKIVWQQELDGIAFTQKEVSELAVNHKDCMQQYQQYDLVRLCVDIYDSGDILYNMVSSRGFTAFELGNIRVALANFRNKVAAFYSRTGPIANAAILRKP